MRIVIVIMIITSLIHNRNRTLYPELLSPLVYLSGKYSNKDVSDGKISAVYSVCTPKKAEQADTDLQPATTTGYSIGFFNGSNLGISGLTCFQGTNPWTVSFWANYWNADLNDGGNNMGCISVFDRWTDGFSLRTFVTNRIRLAVMDGDGGESDDYMGNFTFIEKKWQHFVITYSGTQFDFYFDGSHIDTLAWTTGIGTPESDFLLGYAREAYPAKCKLDEVVLCDYAISADQVSSLYDYGAGIDRASYFGTCEPYDNPIVLPASGNQATWASVFKVNDTFHMYYDGTDVIRHCTSTDGKAWSGHSTVLEGDAGEWDADDVGVPVAWHEDGTTYLLYRGAPAVVGTEGTGLATSTDFTTFTKNENNPVLEGTADAWDSNGAESFGIIKVGSTYYTYYETKVGSRKTGIATSTDLENWTKDENNPIFEYGRFCPDVFKYDSKYYLLIPHYNTGYEDYTEIEVYRDDNPTFYSANREYLGVITKALNKTGWDGLDQDTPFVLTDDVNRDSFNASGGELWIYYAGQNKDDNVWGVGLLISESFDNFWENEGS